MCIEGGSAGRKIAFTDYEVCFGNKLCCFVSWGLDYMFLYYYLQSPIFQSAFKENTTGIIGCVFKRLDAGIVKGDAAYSDSHRRVKAV